MSKLQTASRKKLERAFLPPETATYKPMPHHEILDFTAEKFKEHGLTPNLDTEQINLSEDGLLMTCKWQLGSPNFRIDHDYVPLAVLINGNDRRHAFRIGFGTVVFVCLNGVISADELVARKHTPNWPDDLGKRIDEVLEEQHGWYTDLLAFLKALKDYRPTPEEVHSLLIGSMRHDVIASNQIKKVLDIYEQPTYPEYGHGTLYTLHSAYTEVLQGVNPLALPGKTVRLQELMQHWMDGDRPGAFKRRGFEAAGCPLLGALAASPQLEVRIAGTPAPLPS